MLKTGGIEVTKVSDSASGKKISISTTARLAFRKTWPDKAGVRNSILNDFIANMFAGGSDSGQFTPRTGGGEGKIRNVQGSRFIAIATDDGVRVIAVKGSVPELPELPKDYTPPSLGGTSISDSKDPEAGAASAPTSSSPAPASGGAVKQHVVPSFPAIPTTPTSQVIPTAPAMPPAPMPGPTAPPAHPAIPTAPASPAAMPMPQPAMPPAVPAPGTPEQQPGMFERLKRFVGIQGK